MLWWGRGGEENLTTGTSIQTRVLDHPRPSSSMFSTTLWCCCGSLEKLKTHRSPLLGSPPPPKHLATPPPDIMTQTRAKCVIVYIYICCRVKTWSKNCHLLSQNLFQGCVKIWSKIFLLVFSSFIVFWGFSNSQIMLGVRKIFLKMHFLFLSF